MGLAANLPYDREDQVASRSGGIFGCQIDRFEMPRIKTVHFLLHDHLDRGYNSSSSVDVLGKNTCEYIRSKTVDIPKLFLERSSLN